MFFPSDACDVTFDPNTVNYNLALSDNNKEAKSGKQQQYRDHPERFDYRLNGPDTFAQASCTYQSAGKERSIGIASLDKRGTPGLSSILAKVDTVPSAINQAPASLCALLALND